MAKFGAAIRYFHRHDVTEIMMAGKIFKVRLFQRWAWLRHLPDLRTIRMFLPHFWTRKKDCRDDTLLMAIVEEFAAEGIRFAPPTDYAPELLVKEGQLTRRGPTAWQQKDIEFGWRIAKAMGRLDIGQSVAVKDQAVLAVEAVEGTDECIRRAGALCPRRRFHGGQSGQAAAGHALRRAHHRPRHARNHSRRRRQSAGRRSRPNHLPRSSRRGRFRRPQWDGDRGRQRAGANLHPDLIS